MNKITQVLGEFVEGKTVAGVSALITKGGKEVYYGDCGVMDLQSGQAFDRDTIFRIFSMTKIVTAVSMMMLWEHGKFNMDDPISKFIPEFKNTKVAKDTADGKVEYAVPAREITFHDLFTMTSGIPYPGLAGSAALEAINDQYNKMDAAAAADEEAGQPWTTLRYVKEIAACPLCFDPGTHWRYGLSTDVLGGLVEVISGKTLGEFMQDEIFSPLGMVDTGFTVPVEKRGRVATIYTDSIDGIVPLNGRRSYSLSDNRRMQSGGAGLFSTVDDYTKFALMLLGEGEYNGVRLLKPETVRYMASDHLNDVQKADFYNPDDAGYTYGLTMRVLIDTKTSIHAESEGSFGWNGAAGTSIRIDPVKKVTALFAVQRMPPKHIEYLPKFMQAVCAVVDEL